MKLIDQQSMKEPYQNHKMKISDLKHTMKIRAQFEAPPTLIILCDIYLQRILKETQLDQAKRIYNYNLQEESNVKVKPHLFKEVTYEVP